MSKIKALITMLVLGTSSVAVADSSISFHAHGLWGLSAPAPEHQPNRLRGTWVSLTEPMKLARGRGVVDINARVPFNQIRLQSSSGQAFISTITVQYVTGATQLVTVNQWIDARSPMAQFNLDRTAQVDSIRINGSRGLRSGTFQVFGHATSLRPRNG